MKAFLLSFIFFLIYTSGSAQCNWPDTVSSTYKTAAYQITFDKAYFYSETDVTQNGILPEDSMKMALKLMGCIYNQTGATRDSIFQPFTFQFLYYKLNNSGIYEFGFNGYSGQPYADSLYYGKKTGNKTLDSLIDTYDLSFNLKAAFGSYFGTVHSPYPLNTLYVSDQMNIATGSDDFQAVTYLGDNNNITLRRSGDTQLLTFAFRWGDCFSGCMYYKNLTYKFYDSFKISGPFYSDNIPDLPPGPHYLTSNRPVKYSIICSNTDRITYYYPVLASPYKFYTGKPWGKWMVNSTDQTEKMDQNRSLELFDSGTFYISHIPEDSNGVWYHDTFRVNLYQVPPVKEFVSLDTLQFCPPRIPTQDYTFELIKYLDTWLQDSIGTASWKLSRPEIIPDTAIKKFIIETTPPNSLCRLYDTVNYRARFFPAEISRTIEQQCLHTPAVFRPQFPVNVLNCPDFSKDSVCRIYAPAKKSVTYTYLGCSVRENIQVTPRNAPKIPLAASYTLSGYDSLILDAGSLWQSVIWNGNYINQRFTFKAKNQNRKDTIHVNAVESNGCYDTTTIVITQNAVSGLRPISGTGYRVYPNPASRILNIEFDASVTWSVLDLQGRILFSGSGKAEIDVSTWQQGLYIFQIGHSEKGTLLLEILN